VLTCVSFGDYMVCGSNVRASGFVNNSSLPCLLGDYLDFVLYLIFWLQYVLLAYRLISSAFNLGFEDANIPFGPVEGTELSCTYNNCYPSLNLFISCSDHVNLVLTLSIPFYVF